MDIFTTSPRKLLAGAKPHVQGIRSSIDDLTFRGEDFRAHIGGAVILSAPLKRTVEGASTLELVIHDPKGELRRSKLLEAKFDVKVDDLWFRLAGIGRPDHDTTKLTFQARNVDRLRIAPGALQGKRGTYTRAEFWASQVVNEVKGPKIPLWIPELHDVQPIENASQARTAAKTTNVTRGKGLDTGAGLKVKGIPATAEQLRNGETCLSVGASLNAPRNAMLAVIMAGTQENNMTNSDQGSGCLNYFCFISDTAASFDGDYTDLAQTSHSFFTDGFGSGTGAIDYANQGMSPNDICANIERPAEQYRGLYAQWEDQAEEWLAAFDGGSLASSGTVTTTKAYNFQRKADETIWANGTRLFEEVNWRLFEAAGVIYVITEPELMGSKVRARISDTAPGIESITFDYVVGKKVDEIQVTGWAEDWAAPPGTVAVVKQQGELIDGRYLVSTIESDLLDPANAVSVTLKRPQKPLPEPAPETSTKTVGGSISVGGGGGSGDLESLDIDTTPGDPHWGGSADLIHAIADPIAEKHGVSAGGTKESGHTPGGDHDPAMTSAFACDYSGGDMDAFAKEVATVMGDASVVHTYDSISVEAGGVSFAVQVLWQLTSPSPGPGDYAHTGHVHVGAHRA